MNTDTASNVHGPVELHRGAIGSPDEAMNDFEGPAESDAADHRSALDAAVSYLRVSTKEQAEKDGDPEGYSIPAQREANRRKAATLGAAIHAEFIDRGESARSADRP